MKGKFLSLTFLLALASTSLFAAPISGSLFITGDLRVGADFIDFDPLGGPSGDFNVESVSTGTFAGLVQPGGEDDGDIADLNAATAPVGTPFSLPNFLTFAADPSLSFELTFIEAGEFPPCGGANPCSINQFNLLQTSQSVIASFEGSGNVYEGGVLVSTFTGSFSQVLNRTSIASLLGQIQSVGYFDSAFDANFVVTPVPEPGTISMLAVGGALVGLSRFFKRS